MENKNINILTYSTTETKIEKLKQKSQIDKMKRKTEKTL